MKNLIILNLQSFLGDPDIGKVYSCLDLYFVSQVKMKLLLLVKFICKIVNEHVYSVFRFITWLWMLF